MVTKFVASWDKQLLKTDGSFCLACNVIHFDIEDVPENVVSRFYKTSKPIACLLPPDSLNEKFLNIRNSIFKTIFFLIKSFYKVEKIYKKELSNEEKVAVFGLKQYIFK